jgi:hypothetical protein
MQDWTEVLAYWLSSRVEEFETSREPNGRTREEGSAVAVTPSANPNELRRGAFSQPAPKNWARAACVVRPELRSSRGTPYGRARPAEIRS